MLDLFLTRLQELMVILYAISILFYFIDFIDTNRKANRIAFWLLAIVWFMQTIFLFVYMIDIGRFPVLTIFEGLYFYAWVLITLSLTINKFLKMDLILFFTNILGFVIMAIYTFAPANTHSNVMAERLISELLFTHITMAFLSYAAFSLSFVFSVVYVIQYHLLKRKKWGKLLRRLSDLPRLETMSYILNIIGVPILLLSLILGVQWAFLKLPGLNWFDPKIIGSFIVLIVYSVFLYMKVRRQKTGKSLALWNIGSFLIVLINFFLVGSLSAFHVWNT